MLKLYASFRIATACNSLITILVCVIGLFLAGCLRLTRIPPADVATPGETATSTTQAPATLTPTATPIPYPWTDENVVMSGVCFEYALDQAGQVFVLRDAEAHIRFYGDVDASRLCRHPVTRVPFDFEEGHVLAGLWSAGHGCTARHEVLDVQRDDSKQILIIRLKFVTEGACDYELVRPFWIGLEDAADYQIEMVVE